MTNYLNAKLDDFIDFFRNSESSSNATDWDATYQPETNASKKTRVGRTARSLDRSLPLPERLAALARELSELDRSLPDCRIARQNSEPDSRGSNREYNDQLPSIASDRTRFNSGYAG